MGMIGFLRRSSESLIPRLPFSMTLASMGAQSFFSGSSRTIIQKVVVLFFLRTTSPGSDTRPSTRSCGEMLNIRNTGRRMYGSYLFIGIVKSIGSSQWHICRLQSGEVYLYDSFAGKHQWKNDVPVSFLWISFRLRLHSCIGSISLSLSRASSKSQRIKGTALILQLRDGLRDQLS